MICSQWLAGGLQRSLGATHLGILEARGEMQEQKVSHRRWTGSDESLPCLMMQSGGCSKPHGVSSISCR